jgi:raffinose/stachyose/melibiose transport system permease protein
MIQSKGLSPWQGVLKRIQMPITHLLLIGLGILWMYPFLWVVSAAFKTTPEMFSGGLNLIPKEPVLDNFIRAWQVANFRVYFVNTVIVTIAVVLITVVRTSMTGYALGRYDFPGKKILIGALVVTTFLPTGYTIIPVFDLMKALGLLNTLWAVILGESGGPHVLFIMLFAGFFSSLPRDLEDAAKMDGAGFVRIFWEIMLPLARPVMATTIIMRFMWSWNAFFLPLVFTLSKPELRTLGVGMYAFTTEYTTDWTGMAAAATISLIPIIAVFLLLQRYFVEGVAGAIKG